MWDSIKDAIFWVVEYFYNFCGDWGLAIIIVTVIFRLLISPLMHKQTKSMHLMQKVQPRMKEIQQKYKDDPVRQNEEMQKLYAEAKFNPLAGCLPMLLQMPIFAALFQVLNEMSARTHGTEYGFFNIVPSLIKTPAQSFLEGFGTFVPYFILMLVFAIATFVPMFLQQRGKDVAQRQQTLVMVGVMSVVMLFFSWNAPAGVLLFWDTSSLLGVAQQQVSLRIMKKRDTETAGVVEIKPVEVDVIRKSKKKKPSKKGK